MRARLALIVIGMLIVAPGPLARGQDEENEPPRIVVIKWEVARYGVTTVVFDFYNAVGSFDDIGLYLHQELDVVTATVELSDGDWGEQEVVWFYDPINDIWWSWNVEVEDPVWLRFTAEGNRAYAPPEPTPITEARDVFYGATADEGFGWNQTKPGGDPNDPNDLVRWEEVTFDVPEFLGRNQRRLRGEITFDVSWLLRFSVSNEQDPPVDDFGNELGVTSTWLNLRAIENPALAPPNPPAFADAGADRTVPAGVDVVLDGSRTFDSFNLGFDPNDNTNIFEKDRLVFTWEWLSGPARVDPEQEGPYDPTAKVRLLLPGVYEYRLIVDDNVNALPSTDTVVITVVPASEWRGNRAPVAVIAGPRDPVPAGSVVTLYGEETPDGQQLSYDPDGDELAFRWQQTDELGGPLPLDVMQETFQPLSGTDGPTSSWQALTTGSFYFRLLVDDGEYRTSSGLFEVEIIEAQTDGLTERASETPPPDQGSTSGDSASTTGSDQVAPACGAGMLPLAVVPVALCVMRRRIR